MQQQDFGPKEVVVQVGPAASYMLQGAPQSGPCHRRAFSPHIAVLRGSAWDSRQQTRAQGHK
jgi:hypothetical protein